MNARTALTAITTATPVVAAPPSVVGTNPLATRAMLAGLKVTQWTARRLDKRITDEVNHQHGAAADAGRYNKALVAKTALADIVAATNAARAYHYSRTLPWLDDGARILPAAAYIGYTARMRGLRADFEAAVDRFCEAYPSYVTDAQQRLGTLYDAQDYPHVSQIRRRFDFGIRILPMPDASDFRAGLSDHQAAEIRAEIEATTRAALEGAMRDAWDRIAETVGRMVERLNAYKPAPGVGARAEGVFRDSLVENVRDLVAVLPSFNLTGDAFLTALTARMEEQLCAFDACELREDEALRKSTADAAQAILADMADYLA